MKDRGVAWSVVVLVALTAMVFGPGVRADILITTGGKEWRGKVTDEGDRYVVELPNGGKIGFPKKVVAEVIEEAALAGKFEAELEEADLTKDEEVNRLCELAEKYGLPEQRGDMLLSAYELRRREAKDDVEALRGLANWCKKYDLQGQAAGCESDANQLEFQARRAAAGEDALALAGLAKWCQECGLKPEAEEAEAAALKIAPDDPEVRKQLGYARDEAKGQWVKAHLIRSATPGRKKWAFRLAPAELSSISIGRDGTVYAVSNGVLYAITPEGKKKWAVALDRGADCLHPVIGSAGDVYVASRSGRVHAITPDGKSKWTFRHPSLAGVPTLDSITAGMLNAPAISADGTLYVSNWDGVLHAIGPDGKMKWTYHAGDRIFANSPSVGADGTIYLTSRNGIHAVSAVGQRKWQFGGVMVMGDLKGTPAIGADGTVYFAGYTGEGKGKLWAVTQRGKKTWGIDIGDVESSSPAIGADGTIYVGVGTSLVAVDAEGKEKWRFRARDEIMSSPAVGDDGIIYIGSVDRSLYAVHPDGTKSWSFETDGAILASPAVADGGAIYIVSSAGTLYAISSTSLGLARSSWPMLQRDPQHTSRFSKDPIVAGREQ